MIVKVKEPQAVERARLREGQVLFTYLHLAPDLAADRGSDQVRRDLHRLRDRHRDQRRPAAAGADVRGRRPHVDPGRRDALEKANGGRGMLLGGVPGRGAGQGGDPRRRRGRRECRADGGRPGRAVTVLDRNVDVLRRLVAQFGTRIEPVFSSADAIEATC
jgi:alanine dehydrogenase